MRRTRRPWIADLDEAGATGSCWPPAATAVSATPTSRARFQTRPRHANPGLPGQERWLWLRLKLIADVGLVGLPNAGKSTFLAAASAARPKIADYPFTTLTPNLGMVDLSTQERFVIADIPGLIEGASEGAGLGVRFLGHVERTAVLLHLIDGTQEDVADAWRTVRAELDAYGQELGDKIELVALNKIDALDEATREARAKALKAACKQTVHLVSGVSGEGVKALLRAAFAEVSARRAAEGRNEAGEPGGLASMSSAAHRLAACRRVVVKVGSALVVDGETGEPNRAWLAALAVDAARMTGRGQQLLIVSSGAVALGRRRLGLGRRPLELPEKQAAAAAGQSLLMRAWEEAFEPYGMMCAQVLLTREDTETRRRWLNGKATMDTLLALNVVPIVNENDTVATEEIRYGDNDRLAARVAQMIGADLLVLLSDVDGLYTADPRVDPLARRLEVVSRTDARDRGHGRRLQRRRRGGRGRHGHQDRGRAHRPWGGLRHPHHPRTQPPCAPAKAGGGRRALHPVRALPHPFGRLQTMDRRLAGAPGRADGGRRRWATALRSGKSLLPGRRAQGGGPLRQGRRGAGAGRLGPGSGAGLVAL